MPEIPECLNRRYRALDELIKELTMAVSPQGSVPECPMECPSDTNSAGIKLMCDFWNILKENPDCNLPLEVQQRMNLIPKHSRVFRPQHITCYMAGKSCSDNEDKKKKNQSPCCQSRTPSVANKKSTCCASKSATPTPCDPMPLSKVLCNLKEAASFEKKCTAKVSKLMETQKELQNQIQALEDREKEGVQLLKQADCMWSCMEEIYKTKVAESLERQKVLTKQMKEIEASANKWRKNKKDLEIQMSDVGKCHDEIKEKINQKLNDLKVMDVEIEDFKKRITNAKKDTENAKNSLSRKRASCDAKVAKIMQDIAKVQKQLTDEEKHKAEKEQEGNGYIKEAREDLQKMCKMLLRKKLENEDLLAEKNALLEEIEILKQTCDQCKEKCLNKHNTINDEMKKIDAEIAAYKVKCIRCHQCTDTVDVRKLCSDCPRCKDERECLYEDDHCSPDHSMDCVCISVKQKFLDNVFDNMYTILERHARTGPGKAVADAVLNCLKRSRNGKLDEETRNILQEFILTTVKKNLNLTIVGGAVKTRCEMDSETYKQLMLCLKQVKVTQPKKEDKGTAAKKEPCLRWGGTSECNCPKGPKGCICTKKAPPPSQDPTPCPPPDKEDAAAVPPVSCPHKESASCGPDCSMRAVPSAVGTDVSAWRPDPCKEQSCPFSKNMRAAQCMLGPESLSSLPKGRTTAPYVPDVILENSVCMPCNCGSAPTKRCLCHEDRRCRPRERIIEEVMGRYTEVSPIEKVVSEDNYYLTEMATSRRKDKYRDRTYYVTRNSSENGMESSCSCINAKHLTVGEMKNFNEGSSTRCHVDRGQHRFSHVGTVMSNYTYEFSTEQFKDAEMNEKMSSKNMHDTLLIERSKIPEQDKVKNKEDTDNTKAKQKIIQEKVKNSSEIIITNINGSSKSLFIELNKTSSGALVVELDEQVLLKMEDKLNEDKNLGLFLQETPIGHYIICINGKGKNNNRNESKSVKLGKTPSGNRYFEIRESIIKILKPNNTEEQYKNVTDLSSLKKQFLNSNKIQVSIDSKFKYNKFDHIGNISLFNTPTLFTAQKIIPSQIELELCELYEQGSRTVTIIVKIDDRVSDKENVPLIKTSSGNIAIVLQNKFSPGAITPKEYPVLLEKISSYTYLLNIYKNQHTNAVIKTTSSENFLLVTTNKSEIINKTNRNRSLEEYFKVKVNGNSCGTIELPAVLKVTDSQNYMIVLDKEFEKCYKQTIRQHISNDSKCYVDLNKTDSETFIINLFDTEDVCVEDANALLVKTPSGSIKIYVKSVVIDRIYKLPNKKSSVSSAKKFGELIHKLPESSREFHREQLRKTKFMGEKSSSDSNLYDKVSRPEIEDFLSKAPVDLKKTISGKYAIVLNKESKQRFIKNLKSYLAVNSHGLIPIKRTESGEITIVLNNKNKERGLYGSLKITPSGNIYVLVDKNVIKDIVKKDVQKCGSSSSVDTGSTFVISTVKQPINKAVATTCNATSDDLSCDKSKCICEELQWDTISWFSHTERPRPSDNIILNGVKKNACVGDKQCVHNTCTEIFSPTFNSNKTLKEKSPHIVIKPCSCSSTLNNSLGSIEQCYYVVDSVCPYHKDRYSTVSNELLEISGFCIKPEENTSYNIELAASTEELGVRGQEMYNSLDFLPPQLPPFLRNVNYS